MADPDSRLGSETGRPCIAIKQPVFLPKGSVISMRYHYDNSAANLRNPQSSAQARPGRQSRDR